MIVVSDTSPLMNLAVVGRLDLLQRLFHEVLIPEAVYDELVVDGKAGETEIRSAPWITAAAVSNKTLVIHLQQTLDKGESEAIALAVETKASLLLIDESKGRTEALRLGVDVTGILGILLRAKERQFVPSVKTVLDEMMTRAGFWVDEELYSTILARANEL